jgi:hypothetical protein
MKLITHNMLSCHIKGVRSGYPFLIEVGKIGEQTVEFDAGKSSSIQPAGTAFHVSSAALLEGGARVERSRATCLTLVARRGAWAADFLKHIFPRINWPAFLQGAEAVSPVYGLLAEHLWPSPGPALRTRAQRSADGLPGRAARGAVAGGSGPSS